MNLNVPAQMDPAFGQASGGIVPGTATGGAAGGAVGFGADPAGEGIVELVEDKLSASDATDAELEALIQRLQSRLKRKGFKVTSLVVGKPITVLGVEGVVQSVSDNRLVIFRKGYVPRKRQRRAAAPLAAEQEAPAAVTA